MKMPQTEQEEILLGRLEEVINQACSCGTPTETMRLDSMSISAYSDAMRLLAEYGRLKIFIDRNRRVLADWNYDEQNTPIA